MRTLSWRSLTYEQTIHQKQKDFKMHLDRNHYATIEQKNGQISVVCILCQKSNQNLPQHQTHLAEKHSYMLKKYQTPQKNQHTSKDQNEKHKLSSKQMKQRLKQIGTVAKVKMIQEKQPNKWIVEYQNKEYEMVKYCKEYNGMEYDQNNVFSELVLAPILLNQLSDARFFSIEKNPLERTILCDSYVLCEMK